MILSGDIGGTNTRLALFDEEAKQYLPLRVETFPSRHYSNLATIVQKFLGENRVQKACFAVAGPVIEGICKATNLPWIIDSHYLAQVLAIPNLYLLNDLEANAWAIEILPPESIFELYAGTGAGKGNRAVVSPGTGLGEAGLYWNGERYFPFASEGGHCEFGPQDALQVSLSHYLIEKFGHSSYERVLSGPGLHNIYLFYKEALGRGEPAWLTEALSKDDPAKVISENALTQKSELCVEVLNLFITIFGAEVGNCALKFMATGGVYLGGGIPPKILPRLKDPFFFTGFFNKGRMRGLLEALPIRVILDDQASLKGAFHYCLMRAI